jgi:beta-lactamase class A
MSQQIFYGRLQEALTEKAQALDGVMGLAFKDLVSGHEITIRGDTIFPIGSSIKIAILLEFFRQAKTGKFSVNDRVWVEKHHKVNGSGVLQFMGDHSMNCSLRDLAALMINVSDNAATNMLIDVVGMDNVNANLQRLGLKSTRLERKMMDEPAAKKGNENVSTPKEMMSLLTKLYKCDGIEEDVSTEALTILKMPKLEQYLSAGVPPDVVVANKPGMIPGVFGDSGIVYLPERPYVLSVLTTYLRDPPMGQEAVRKVSKIVYDHAWRVSKSTEIGRRFVP